MKKNKSNQMYRFDLEISEIQSAFKIQSFFKYITKQIHERTHFYLRHSVGQPDDGKYQKQKPQTNWKIWSKLLGLHNPNENSIIDSVVLLSRPLFQLLTQGIGYGVTETEIKTKTITTKLSMKIEIEWRVCLV